MDTDKCSIYELFEQSKRHVVPLYQRPYVWSAAQWESLWEDITAKVGAVLEERPTTPHFLGAVVRSQAPAPGLKLDVRLVIDGQQRLTTFQILLAVLRDLTAEYAKEEKNAERREELEQLAQDFSKVTVNSGGVKNEIERFKVLPTNADRQTFERVMTARSMATLDERFPPQYKGKRTKVRIPDSRLLVEAYRYFDESIRELLKEAREERRVLEAFLDCIRNHLLLVIIDLDQDDDPQVIFETLNFRGTPLLASDLIKNFLFGKASAQQHDAETVYLEYWRHFDDDDVEEGQRFWKREIRQGRLTRAIFDLFLEHYLVAKTDGEPIVSRHLYQAFKACWRPAYGQVERDVVAELRDIARYSATYRAFFEPQSIKVKSPRVSTFLARIKTVDMTTIYPLLLFLLAEGTKELPVEQRDAILVDLESFVVRRWICNKTNKNYNRLFGAMIRDLRKRSKVDHAAVRERLLGFGGVDAWPSDDEFEAAWLREPVYKRIKSDGIQMVLRAVHDALLTSKQEGIQLPENLTVEHVMPQQWDEHWPPPAPESATEEESAEERRNRLLHTFGNLTLLTQGLNAEVSNSEYGKKQPHLTKDSLLLLNAYFQTAGTWDESAILTRGRSLFAHAKKTWPRPT